MHDHEACEICIEAKARLHSQQRPPFEQGPAPLRCVDLFCGAGGMSLGLAEAAHAAGLGFAPLLAVDMEPRAVAVYRANFPGAQVLEADVCSLLNGNRGRTRGRGPRTLWEVAGRRDAAPNARVDFLVGGPPCQGHSNLNNSSRRSDPRNKLYLAMLQAAAILRPRAILIENVSTVRHAREGVIEAVEKHLPRVGPGYRVAHRVIDVSKLGVAQARKRHVLLALADELSPDEVLDEVLSATCQRTTRWAICDLVKTSGRPGLMDQVAGASEENRRRMAWFFSDEGRGQYNLPNPLRPPCHRDKVHTYYAVYGRLRWDEPAPTLTSGFYSTGQGRHVHPDVSRTITAREAARLQSFPDFYDFDSARTRNALATLLGNAVPPLLVRTIASAVIRRWRGAAVEMPADATAGRPAPALPQPAERDVDQKGRRLPRLPVPVDRPVPQLQMFVPG